MWHFSHSPLSARTPCCRPTAIDRKDPRGESEIGQYRGEDRRREEQAYFITDFTTHTNSPDLLKSCTCSKIYANSHSDRGIEMMTPFPVPTQSRLQDTMRAVILTKEKPSLPVPVKAREEQRESQTAHTKLWKLPFL